MTTSTQMNKFLANVIKSELTHCVEKIDKLANELSKTQIGIEKLVLQQLLFKAQENKTQLLDALRHYQNS